MALESTLVPIPSEVIIPPAAYLAHTQGQFSFLGVVLAGTAGSWMGASLMYWAARLLGRPIIVRFGRYVGLGQAKVELAERWCAHYGALGVHVGAPVALRCRCPLPRGRRRPWRGREPRRLVPARLATHPPPARRAPGAARAPPPPPPPRPPPPGALRRAPPPPQPRRNS